MDTCIEFANQVAGFAASVGFVLGIVVTAIIGAIVRKRAND